MRAIFERIKPMNPFASFLIILVGLVSFPSWGSQNLPDPHPENKSFRVQGYYTLQMTPQYFLLYDYDNQITGPNPQWKLGYSALFYSKPNLVQQKQIDYVRRLDVFNCSNRSYKNQGMLLFQRNTSQPVLVQAINPKPFDNVEWRAVPETGEVSMLYKRACSSLTPAKQTKITTPINADAFVGFYRKLLEQKRFLNGSHWLPES